jgi:MFS transporter, YNFM family, putative membrane transport protein
MTATSLPAQPTAGSVAPAAPLPTRAMMLLAVATFSATANLRVTDSLLPQVAREFSTSIGTAAVIVTAFSLAFGCFQLFYGHIGDRLGKYRVVMAVCFVSALATGSCAFMPTLDTLAAARFVSGVASAAIVPLGMAWIGDVVPYEQRQGILGKFLTGQILGMVFGQAAGGMLGDLIGWRWVFLVLGCVHLAGGLGLLVEITRNPSLHAAPPAKGKAGIASILEQFRSVLRRPWARIVLIGVFAEGFAMFGAFTYIGADLHQRFGLGFGAVGLMLGAYGTGGIVYAWSARRLVDRLGERGLVGIGAVLAALSYGALVIAPGPAAAFAAILGLGTGYWMLHNTLQTHATQMAPDARGVAMSMFASCFFMGQSLGVALAALLVDRQGPVPVFLAGGAALLVIGFWFRRRLTRRG